jgi:hypothetical protein
MAKKDNKVDTKRFVEYIIECRKRGFDDFIIRKSLIKKGWPQQEISKAFYTLDGGEKAREEIIETEFGQSVTIFLEAELLKWLEKRAKKNMLALPEQIEDILRRSTINQKGKKSPYDAKLDDSLVGVFSRKNTGQKTKKRKIKKEKKSDEELTREQERRNKKRSRSLKKHYRKDRIKARKEKRMKERVERKG